MRSFWSCTCLFICGLLIATLPLLAQAPQTVWLYQPDEGRAFRISADGVVQDNVDLPLESGERQPETIAVHPDGNRFAYVVRHSTTQTPRLIIYDVETNSVRASFSIPDSPIGSHNADDQIFITPNSFHHTESLFAFTYRIGGDSWWVAVLDMQSGEIVHSLGRTDGLLAPYPSLQWGHMPMIQDFREDVVSFTLPNAYNNPSPIAHSYTWFLSADTVRETVVYPTFKGDLLLHTGESIHPLPDFRFAFENEAVPRNRLQQNSIHAYANVSLSRFPTFTLPDLDFLNVTFIQGGERFLITAWEDTIRRQWVIADRTGNEVKRIPLAGYDVSGTSDGFVYLTELGEQTVLVGVDTRAFLNNGETIWVGDGEWQLIWSSMTASNNLIPFAQLASAIESPDTLPIVGATPTLLPTPLPMLYVGLEAQVQMFDDELLNLRDAPTINSNVLAFLKTTTYLTLLEGPFEAEGYQWWRVRVGNREGWVVDNIEDVQTVIPRQPIIEETEEPEEE